MYTHTQTFTSANTRVYTRIYVRNEVYSLSAAFHIVR